MKIGLFAQSLGGLIACHYLISNHSADFLILSSPLLERKKLYNIFYFLPYKLLHSISIKKRHSESLEMLEYSRKDPLSCKNMTLRLLGEIFINGINKVHKNLAQINCPLLLLGGSEDNLVNSKNFEKLIKNFGSRDKTLKIYQSVQHRLVHSLRKDEIINDIANWVKEKTSEI